MELFAQQPAPAQGGFRFIQTKNDLQNKPAEVALGYYKLHGQRVYLYQIFGKAVKCGRALLDGQTIIAPISYFESI
jgi:hypothetical protein